MRILTAAAIIVATAVSGTAAFAQTSQRISDVDFIRANRCAGLAAATGASNATAFTNVVKRQSIGRDDTVVTMARRAGEKATNQVRNASETRGAKLRAELDGACQKYAG
ncbi:MAG: hypothetical protein Q7U20_00485 [Caulobacter sp.]|nr:hypothetical protein [Caulobacter sp.]